MRCALVLVATASVACAKIESEPVFPAASFTVTPEADLGITVTSALYTMHFAGNGDVPIEEAAMHFPDSLTLDGSPNVLGPQLGCNNEQLVGMAMFPAFVTAPPLPMVPSSEGITLPPNTNDLELNNITQNSAGPHVVQIGVRYTVDYSCMNNERFEGRTAFTLFPNGRIVRHDFEIRPSTNPITAADQDCGCGTASVGNPLAFTSFWTFAESNGRMVQRNGTPLTFSSPADSDQNGPFDGLCTIYDDRAIGVSYAGGISRARNNTPSNFAHVFDFNFDPTLAPVVREGTGGDPDELYQVTSAIKLDPRPGLANGDCGSVLEGLTEPRIEVNGTDIGLADPDGIYNDFLSHDDAFTIRTPVEDLPAGWAFRTLIPSGAATITRDPAFDDDRPIALVQRESNDENIFLFYFPDPLEAGQTITIEPK